VRLTHNITEQDIWAPPLGRRYLGAAVWAHGRLGAGRLGAGMGRSATQLPFRQRIIITIPTSI